MKGGGARPNLFNCKVNFPAYALGDAELYVFHGESGKPTFISTGLITVPFRGRQLKIAGDRTFETWTVTVINDTDFAVRDAMERWMNGINSHNANTGFSDPAEYQTDLTVEQLDKDGIVLKSYNFRSCFPTNISAIELSYETVDAIEEFTVEFQVQYWESNTTS